MYEKLTLFRVAGALADHAGRAQAMIARNIANADTPGFQAKHLAPFAATIAQLAPNTQRDTHLMPSWEGVATTTDSQQRSPNGNAVSLEEEMVAATTATRDHEQALAVYRHGMTVLRTAIGRR